MKPTFAFVPALAVAALLAAGAILFAESAAAQSQGGAPAAAPSSYQTPFPAPHASSPGEEADFAKLQQLFDKNASDVAAYETAKACGTRDDQKSAYGAATVSYAEFKSALDAFARNWSNTLYPTATDRDGNLSATTDEDNARIVAELRKHAKKIGLPACAPKPGATTPPPAAPPNVPPCDSGTAAAEIAAAEKEVASIQRLVEQTDRVAAQDRHAYDSEVAFSGKDSAKSEQLYKVFDADLGRAIDLVTKKESLLKKIASLKALKPCPVPNAVAPPATPLTPAPALSPCYDDAAKNDFVKSEKDLADLNTAIDEAQGDVDDDKAKLARAQQAYGPDSSDAKGYKEALKTDTIKLSNLLGDRLDLQIHIDALKALESCPMTPGKPEKTSHDNGFLGDVLGHVTIGVGVGGGKGRDDHRDNRHTDKPPTDAHSSDTPPTDAPAPHD